MVTLYLTINKPIHQAITEVSCESYTWNGQTYTASGTYTYTHTDANGCTQVDTLHLTIAPSYSFSQTDSVQSFDSYVWVGHPSVNISTYMVGQFTYYDSLQTIYGCDSVYQLTIHVLPIPSNAFSATAQASYVEDDVMISFNMENDIDITAVQFDVQLPVEYNVQSSDFVRSQRCSGHTLTVMNIGNNTWRVMLFSMSNALISGHSGEVVGLTLHPTDNTPAGDYTCRISNVVLSDIKSINRVTEYMVMFTFTTNCHVIQTFDALSICESELPYYYAPADTTLGLGTHTAIV